MAMLEAKLSAKNQIVVPREAREALKVRAGDKILVVIRNGTVILLPRPQKYSKEIAASMTGKYPLDYLNSERNDW